MNKIIKKCPLEVLPISLATLILIVIVTGIFIRTFVFLEVVSLLTIVCLLSSWAYDIRHGVFKKRRRGFPIKYTLIVGVFLLISFI
ncbi:hypothetical protein HXA34_01955 [Salipaludibacillus agaradhaerens]|uniref:hypothetical protein n=1 Tax=Salipaludibacillus agaradhaerens TaxID=76935 RepID=UPI002151C58D|nr:hypothetical protein [Salipaludibacillus agaradhaerens]MCR6105047.1 hypothetical protein [Salipaludibacillus agaradhaerens]MCR6117092.1 hypothetical protein [Salipaludibacillus agaradhaerens]